MEYRRGFIDDDGEAITQKKKKKKKQLFQLVCVPHLYYKEEYSISALVTSAARSIYMPVGIDGGRKLSFVCCIMYIFTCGDKRVGGS